MRHVTMTERETWAIVTALRLAAEQYESTADVLCDKRTIQAFRDQQAEALAMADRLEGAASLIVLED